MKPALFSVLCEIKEKTGKIIHTLTKKKKSKIIYRHLKKEKKEQYNATNPSDTAIFTGVFFLFVRQRSPVVSRHNQHPHFSASHFWKWIVIIGCISIRERNMMMSFPPLCVASWGWTERLLLGACVREAPRQFPCLQRAVLPPSV